MHAKLIDFCVRTGRGMKHIARPPSDIPYVVDRLKRNVELDRRFYMKVAERGLMDCIRPEVCLDECVPYFKLDKRTEARAYDERCLDLTRRLRDTCLDEECDVCDEMIEEETSSSSSEEDVLGAGGADGTEGMDGDEDVGPCRAKCSPNFESGGKEAQAPGEKVTVMARMRTMFRGQPPPKRRNPLGGPKETTGVNAATLDSTGSLRSVGSEETESSATDTSDSHEEETTQRSPWPAAPVAAMYTLTTTEMTPTSPREMAAIVPNRFELHESHASALPFQSPSRLSLRHSTLGLRDTRLDVECNVLDGIVENKSSSTISLDEITIKIDGDEFEQCRIKCTTSGPSTSVLASAGPTSRMTLKETVLAMMRTIFWGQEKASPPPRGSLLCGLNESTELNTARLDVMRSLCSVESEESDGTPRWPWPAPRLTALYSLAPSEPTPSAPRVQFAPAVTLNAPVVAAAAVEPHDSYPSHPKRATQPPNALLIRDECPDKFDKYRWYKRWFLLWIFDIRDTHRTRGVQVYERDIATAYDPTLVYDDYSGDLDPKIAKKVQRKLDKEKRRKHKSTSPMTDVVRKQAAKDALDQKKREAKELQLKEKAREKRRIQRAKERARRKKIKPKVICECKAREFKIIEARKQTPEAWGSWCPPDAAPESEASYEEVTLTTDDVALLPVHEEVLETRDLIIQIDLPPIEPGTALSDEMYDPEQLNEMGSIEVIDNTGRSRRSRLSNSGIYVATSIDKTLHPSIPIVPKTPRPPPRNIVYSVTPRPKPRVREIVMQTDSDPGPLREQNIQYEKQCVCKPGPTSKCTCKKEGASGPCSCKTASPLDGGPPCICKPKFGPGYLTKRRKKCKSRKCKKCREKGLSGRDQMAKIRTKDEKAKDEAEKIRIEKAKMKAVRDVAKFEGKQNRGALYKEKLEMKAAAAQLKEQMREKEAQAKEAKRREIAQERRLRVELKEQKRQEARDEDYRRRLSEMRKPEAEFCGCKDWEKGLCRVKVPPDILEAREAMLKAQQDLGGKVMNKRPQSLTVMLARSIDNSDSEFILPNFMQPRRQETLHKSKYETCNSVTIATVSREISNSVFEATNRLSLSEIGFQGELSGHHARELPSWYDDIGTTCSSSFRRKSYSSQRLLKQNDITKGSQGNTIDITPKTSPENTYGTLRAYARRRSSSPTDAEDHEAVATTSASVNKYVKSMRTQLQATKRRRLPKPDILTNALEVDNEIITLNISNKKIRPRRRPVCANVAETVFTHSEDETRSIIDTNQSILTEDNNSTTSKSGLYKFVEKVFSKRKDRSKERLRYEIQHNCNQVKGFPGSVPKYKSDKNKGISTEKCPQGGIKIENSRFTKRKFGKNIVTSLISIFNNSSCHKGASNVISARSADSRIAEEPSDGQVCGRSLFATESGATSVAERPGRHLLGSPNPAGRAARSRDQPR